MSRLYSGVPCNGSSFSTVSEVTDELRKIVSTLPESSVTIGKLGRLSRQMGEIVATIEEVADMTAFWP
jgi:methyl-accepting chemotaxis protein